MKSDDQFVWCIKCLEIVSFNILGTFDLFLSLFFLNGKTFSVVFLTQGSSYLWRVPLKQCDQMVKLLLNVWIFKALKYTYFGKIFAKVVSKFCQRVLIFYQSGEILPILRPWPSGPPTIKPCLFLAIRIFLMILLFHAKQSKLESTTKQKNSFKL